MGAGAENPYAPPAALVDSSTLEPLPNDSVLQIRFPGSWRYLLIKNWLAGYRWPLLERLWGLACAVVLYAVMAFFIRPGAAPDLVVMLLVIGLCFAPGFIFVLGLRADRQFMLGGNGHFEVQVTAQEIRVDSAGKIHYAINLRFCRPELGRVWGMYLLQLANQRTALVLPQALVDAATSARLRQLIHDFAPQVQVFSPAGPDCELLLRYDLNYRSLMLGSYAKYLPISLIVAVLATLLQFAFGSPVPLFGILGISLAVAGLVVAVFRGLALLNYRRWRAFYGSDVHAMQIDVSPLGLRVEILGVSSQVVSWSQVTQLMRQRGYDLISAGRRLQYIIPHGAYGEGQRALLLGIFRERQIVVR